MLRAVLRCRRMHGQWRYTVQPNSSSPHRQVQVVARNHKGRNVMRRLGVLIATTVLLVIWGAVLPSGDALAQQKSLKEQLVGTWIYVSSTSMRADGSKTETPDLKGIVIYTSDGHFAFVSVRADLPKLANPDRARATPFSSSPRPRPGCRASCCRAGCRTGRAIASTSSVSRTSSATAPTPPARWNSTAPGRSGSVPKAAACRPSSRWSTTRASIA